MKRPLLAGLAFSLLVVAHAAAQPAPGPVFTSLDTAAADRAAQNAPARSGIVLDRQIVGMRLDRLFGQSDERVRLNAGTHDWIARFDHLDPDVLGYRTWVGTIDGIENSHVSFTERDGVVAGVIDALATKYQVRTVSPGVYALDQIGIAKGGDEGNDVIAPPADDMALAASAMNLAQDDAGTIDVLLLWTPAARGSGTTANMQALAAQIISDSNTAYSRSGITTRLRLVGASELPYVETTYMSDDLSNLRANTSVGSTRDALGADLVHLILSSTDSPCGVGYLLNGNASYGFSVGDVLCVNQYTPTHEMGHNMGSHHAPEDICTMPCTPWGGYYSYSYGYKDPISGFRTIMAYSCSGSISCPRTLNLSNPAVNHSSGYPTGTATQNNALSINNTAFTVANFRAALATTTTPPGAPTGLSAAVNGTNVTLSWSAVAADMKGSFSAATSYAIQVGTASGVYNALPNFPVGNTTTISGSGPAGTYYWRVVASNSAGSGPPSAQAQFTLGGCTAPGAPQSFTHTVGTGRVVTLSWAAPATGAGPFSYTIEAGSTTGLSNIVIAPVGATTAVSLTAPAGTYYVRIRAQNACGTSAASAERTIVVP